MDASEQYWIRALRYTVAAPRVDMPASSTRHSSAPARSLRHRTRHAEEMASSRTRWRYANNGALDPPTSEGGMGGDVSRRMDPEDDQVLDLLHDSIDMYKSLLSERHLAPHNLAISTTMNHLAAAHHTPRDNIRPSLQGAGEGGDGGGVEDVEFIHGGRGGHFISSEFEIYDPIPQTSASPIVIATPNINQPIHPHPHTPTRPAIRLLPGSASRHNNAVFTQQRSRAREWAEEEEGETEDKVLVSEGALRKLVTAAHQRDLLLQSLPLQVCLSRERVSARASLCSVLSISSDRRK